MKIVYRNKLMDLEVERASVVIEEHENPSLKEPYYEVVMKEQGSQENSYETFDTYDGALVKALEFILQEALQYSNLKQEVDYQ